MTAEKRFLNIDDFKFSLKVFFAAVASTCALLFSPAAFAASFLDMKADDESSVTWNLKADKVNALNEANVIEAFGKVHLQRGQDYLKADYARYYNSTQWVFLQGNVEVHFGADTINAREAEFDLANRTGWMKDGTVFMAGPHTYVTGARVDKHWGDVYSFKDAKVTSCDGDAPAWSFTASEAVIEMDGYAQLWGTSFQVKDVPVLFSPFLVVPVKKERQSGLLLPSFGYSDTRGFFYNQPYFWAIDDSRDLTLNEYVMTDRGFMQGLEYRSRRTEDESLWLRFDWMYDSETFATDADDKYYKGDGLARDNSSRFWVRGMYNASLPNAPLWKFRADLDYVSDPYFLREFDTGASGFNYTRMSLSDLFSRSLRERDLSRVSGAILSRDWERVGVAVSAQYTQNPDYGNGNIDRSKDITVQYLPQADFFLYKGRVFDDLPFEAQGSAQGGYMYRRYGDRGARYDISPGLSLPINGKYGSLRVMGAVNQTFYQTETSDDVPGYNGQTGESRTVFSFGAEASTELARVYRLGNDENREVFAANNPGGASRWTGIQHSIEPRVAYARVPHVDQEKNPYYDGYDRISERNELVYSLDNNFSRKRERVVVRKDKDGKEEKVVAEDYLNFLRIRLAQGYDIAEAGRDSELDVYDRRPFGDVIGEVTLSGNEYVSLTSKSYLSPYSGDLTRHSHGINLNVPEWGSISTGMSFYKAIDEYKRHRPEDISLVTLSGNMHLYGPWSAYFYKSWDMRGELTSEQGLELTYTDQCYQIGGRIWEDDQETSFQLFFSLSGLGEIGIK